MYKKSQGWYLVDVRHVTPLIGEIIQEWRKCNGTQVSIAMERRTNVLALEVVEDFMYLNCSSSPTILEVISVSFIHVFI